MKIYLVHEDGQIEEKKAQAMPGKELVDVTDLDPIVLSNVLEIIKRSRVGVAKYGTTLAENSSDDFLQHAKEEAMDFINYLEKLRQSAGE